ERSIGEGNPLPVTDLRPVAQAEALAQPFDARGARVEREDRQAAGQGRRLEGPRPDADVEDLPGASQEARQVGEPPRAAGEAVRRLVLVKVPEGVLARGRHRDLAAASRRPISRTTATPI